MVFLRQPRLEGIGVGEHEFTMSLGIRHPDVDPVRITRALGLRPEHVWRSGDQRQDHAGETLGGEHRESYWICDLASAQSLSDERTDLQSELTRILDTLRRSMPFMQELHHGGGTAELFISVFSRGDFRLELLVEETALLARLGVTVAIEVRSYPAAARAAARS